MNLVVLTGNLASDPEKSSDKAPTKFRLATNDSYRDREGNLVERANFHQVSVWGRQGESCLEYLKKGRGVTINGSIEYSTIENDDGTKKYFTTIKANRVEFHGRGDGASSGDSGGGRSQGRGSGRRSWK